MNVYLLLQVTYIYIYHALIVIGWGFCHIENYQGRGRCYQSGLITLTEVLTTNTYNKTEFKNHILT